MIDTEHSLPGMNTDIFFGDAEKPLPDWREDLPDDDSDDDDLSDDERAKIVALIGFDPAEKSGSQTDTAPRFQSGFSKSLRKCGGEGGTLGPCPSGRSEDKPGDKPPAGHDLDRGKLPATAGEAHQQAAQTSDGILKRAADMPKKAVAYGVNKAKTLYATMEQKYGPKWAKAIVATAVVTAPTPVMTASIMAVVGLAALHKRLSPAKSASELDMDRAFEIAQIFVRELVKSLEGVKLTDEERRQVEATAKQ